MHNEPPFPSSARVLRTRRGSAAAVTAIACAALISACGSSSSTTTSGGTKTPLNTARVALSIEQSVLAQRKLHVSVVCPPSVPQEKGRVFECIATSRAVKPPHAIVKTPFVVTIKTNKGYVTYVGK